MSDNQVLNDEAEDVTIEELLSSVMKTTTLLGDRLRRSNCGSRSVINNKITPGILNNTNKSAHKDDGSVGSKGVNFLESRSSHQKVEKSFGKEGLSKSSPTMVRSASTPEITAKLKPAFILERKSVNQERNAAELYSETGDSRYLYPKVNKIGNGRRDDKQSGETPFERFSHKTTSLSSIYQSNSDAIIDVDNSSNSLVSMHKSYLASMNFLKSSTVGDTPDVAARPENKAEVHLESPFTDWHDKVYDDTYAGVKLTTSIPGTNFESHIVNEVESPIKIPNFRDLPKITVMSPKQSLELSRSDIICVNNQGYFKLRDLGKGGSSVVYEVLELSSRLRKAIKIVDLKNEDDSIRESYRNEIKILTKLQNYPHIIRVYDHEETQNEIKIVMEAGTVDLAKIISESRKKHTDISSFSIQHYWQEMLLAVRDIHMEGIVHSDLKPANFLLVSSSLKLIDFGIASSIQHDMTSIFRESQCGTFNYMSPESLNDIHTGPIISGKLRDKPTIKIGVKSDVWSLGCILYNLVYGHTPFQFIVKPLQKLATISNPNTKVPFPALSDANLMNVLKSCLQYNPKDRPTIAELLSHPYLVHSLITKNE